jgi:hypothetical protein
VTRSVPAPCAVCTVPITRKTCGPVLREDLKRAVALRQGVMCSDCLLDRLRTLGSTGRTGGLLTLADLDPCLQSLAWVLRKRPGWLGSQVFQRFVVAVSTQMQLEALGE